MEYAAGSPTEFTAESVKNQLKKVGKILERRQKKEVKEKTKNYRLKIAEEHEEKEGVITKQKEQRMVKKQKLYLATLAEEKVLNRAKYEGKQKTQVRLEKADQERVLKW